MKYVILDNVIKPVEFNFRKRIIDIFQNPENGFNQADAEHMRNSFGIGTI
jgi:hypothetical protein